MLLSMYEFHENQCMEGWTFHRGLFSDTVLYFDVKNTLLMSVDYTTEYSLCGCVTSCHLPSLVSFSS